MSKNQIVSYIFAFNIILSVLAISLCVPQFASFDISISKGQQPVYGEEFAAQESEDLKSSISTKYENSQLAFARGFKNNPSPIVDNINEQDKYGNSGDKFAGIGRGLVNGYESLSNILNSIVDKPFNASRQLSRGLTNKLNEIGGRLVGL